MHTADGGKRCGADAASSLAPLLMQGVMLEEWINEDHPEPNGIQQ
jgi:hypothetical protein